MSSPRPSLAVGVNGSTRAMIYRSILPPAWTRSVHGPRSDGCGWCSCMNRESSIGGPFPGTRTRCCSTTSSTSKRRGRSIGSFRRRSRITASRSSSWPNCSRTSVASPRNVAKFVAERDPALRVAGSTDDDLRRRGGLFRFSPKHVWQRACAGSGDESSAAMPCRNNPYTPHRVIPMELLAGEAYCSGSPPSVCLPILSAMKRVPMLWRESS